MWSGPRNISTAMMRAFENRPDTAVVDEPFYAVYLAKTGADHPMRSEVLSSQPQDWREVVATLTGPMASAVHYQKHMTHHMLPEIGRDWIDGMQNAFLIRDPRDVLASYAEVRGQARLEDIGLIEQHEIFERAADRLGKAPPVVDTGDVLRNPQGVLSALCAALGIAFDARMLRWPAGRRDTDGVWAPAWYASVERSTGFGPPGDAARRRLGDDLQRVADAAMPLYEALRVHKLTP
jgi:hypothetical protein